MDLTVCVCVRDGANHVDRCLEALVSETAPFGTPIVVVDHASQDETPQRLARWAGNCVNRLRVMRFEGEGLAAARDFAWRQSETPWLAFIDIDCEVQPGWAKAVYQNLQTHGTDSRCGGFGGMNRVPQNQDLLHRACSVLLSTYVGGHDSILNRRISERRKVEHCPTLNVVYRRRALEEIDGFDRAYTRVCEDIDVSRRLVRLGYELWADPDMVVEHALRPTLHGWLRNILLYGRGNSFHLKRHPAEIHPKFLAPALIVLAYACAALWDLHDGGPPFHLALLTAAHLSCIALLLASETRRQHGGVSVWAAAAGIVWLTHICFGCGLLFELPRRRDKFIP